MPFICCVPGCGETGKRIFHSFSKDPAQCKKWIGATWCVFLNEDTAWESYYKVCRKHFDGSDLRNSNLLKKGVVPSRMLPHSITMEHDYSTRNSIFVADNHNELNAIASIRHANINDISALPESSDTNVSSSHYSIIMMEHDYCCSTDSIVLAVNDNRTLVSSELNENIDGFPVVVETNGLNEIMEIEEDNQIQIGCEHRVEDIMESELIQANIGPENVSKSSDYQMSNVSKPTAGASVQQKRPRTYDPVARKMKYLLARNKALSQKLKDCQSAMFKSNKKSKIKKKINVVLQTLSLELPPEQYNFIKLQLKNTGKAKKGNRFSFDEKTLALVIYKQNPKRYKDLRKISNLPTRQILIAHSAGIRFKEGINQNLMEYIKKQVSEMGELDEYCTIGWDEMSLTASLDFDHIKDYIDGFEDLASKRTSNFATHALVFMVRGIKSAYKQPVAYFLTENLKAAELAELVRLVVTAVLDTGKFQTCFNSTKCYRLFIVPSEFLI